MNDKLINLRPAEELRCGARTLAEHKKEIKHLWDLIVDLKQDLEKDIHLLGSAIRGKIHPTVVFFAENNVLIEEGVEIEPYAVLDARSGPIYIGKNSIIRPHTLLRGPLSLGPECRIGGEVTHSVFHGYSNKQHYGFIGHSYVGEWVNLGAGTTNSNLKNNYGTVKINNVDSGQQFLGCFIGDFAKLGIGTLIPTGAVIGVGANLFGGGMIPKVTPNFAWGANEKYKLEEFLRDAERTMARRGQSLSKELIAKIKKIY